MLGPLDYQGGRQHHSNIKSSDMCDIWRNFHLTLRQYTRHQRNQKFCLVLILSLFLIISNLVSKILPGIQSDHSIVTLQFSDGQPIKGPGFWKLNCHFLRNNADFIKLIKPKIAEFKAVHHNTECDPYILWDSMK